MRRGFTLLEVMAALAILSVALVVLIRSQTESLSGVQNVQNYERAVFITENQLHWTLIDLNEAEDWREYAALNGQDGSYEWRVSIQPVDSEDGLDGSVTLLRIMAETIWPQGERQGYFSLESWYLWGQEQ